MIVICLPTTGCIDAFKKTKVQYMLANAVSTKIVRLNNCEIFSSIDRNNWWLIDTVKMLPATIGNTYFVSIPMFGFAPSPIIITAETIMIASIIVAMANTIG